MPQFLLERFVEADGSLYVWRKDNGNIFESSPKGTFFETNLYASTSADGRKDLSVEKKLSDIEGKAGNVIRSVIADVQDGRSPRLDTIHRGILDTFFYCQMLRIPDFLNATPTVRAYRAAGGSEGILQKAKVAALDGSFKGEPLQIALEVMRGCQQVVGVAGDMHRFVIGSLPVMLFNDPPGSRRGMIWLPITPKLLIGYKSQDGSRTRPTAAFEIMQLDDRYVENINLAAFRQSSMVASGSEEYLKMVCGLTTGGAFEGS